MDRLRTALANDENGEDNNEVFTENSNNSQTDNEENNDEDTENSHSESYKLGLTHTIG